MKRREVFPILAAAPLAEPLFAQPHVPRFFTAEEFAAVDLLAETLLPADETGPGARVAQVAAYVDITLQYASAARQEAWRRGLAVTGAEARARFGRGAGELDSAQAGALMTVMAAREGTPQSDLERFFARFKSEVVEAFGMTAAGRRALGYRGDRAIPEFPGCTHPEHQS